MVRIYAAARTQSNTALNLHHENIDDGGDVEEDELGFRNGHYIGSLLHHSAGLAMYTYSSVNERKR
jgi:hypothetical protein